MVDRVLDSTPPPEEREDESYNIEQPDEEELKESFEKADKKWKEKKLRKLRNEKKKIIYTSLFIDEDDGIFAEQVYDGINTQFCVYNTKTKAIIYLDNLDFEEVTIMPIRDEELGKKAVLLPSNAEEYGNDEKLDEEIYNFITKWLDIPEDIKQFAIWNIKRSWVYENFHTLNYLRALGDTGMGKTRYLDTLGYLHYKAINTSGATTSAPVFRIIDKWRGTLIIDEADFQKSDESQDIIKIINMGYERGKFVMRCDPENGNKVNFFDPFCPKILATRKTFTDKAVESRCITNVMAVTKREDIPLNLNKEFFETAQKLRNKLLMWRFKNYYKINPDIKIEFDMGMLEPRVKQIISSFVSLFGEDKKQMEKFKIFINNYQEELIDERKNSFEGQVVEAIYKLVEKGVKDISSQDIIIEGNLTNKSGNYITPRGLTSTLKSLGFGKNTLKRVDDVVKRCIPLIKDHLETVFKRYGFDVTVVTNVTDVTVDTVLDDYKNDGKENKTRVPIITVTTVTQLQNKVYQYIKNNPLKSFKETQEATNIPESDLIPIFETLKRSGDIYEKGFDKWGILE